MSSRKAGMVLPVLGIRSRRQASLLTLMAQEKLHHLPTTGNHDEAQMPGADTLMKLI
jgi:hypothetical protein